MNIKRLSLKTAMVFVLGAISLNTNAALVTDTLLTFESSVGCPRV